MPFGSLQRSDGLALSFEAALRPLHAQLGVFKMLFQRKAAGHPASYPPISTLGWFFSLWNRFSPRLVGGVTPGPEKCFSESDFDSGGPSS